MEQPLPTTLAGRIALVTGAGSGIGQGLACCLARHGAAVALAGRRADKLETTSQTIRAGGGTALVVPLDLQDHAAISPAFDAVEASLGPVDTLVNNAGIADANHATKLDIAAIDAVLATNLRAPFLMSAEFARRAMAREARGWVVNLSSVGAFHYGHRSFAALYCATKSGVIRMTEALALEWAGARINVNAIAPGMFESEMTDGYMARVGDRVLDAFPRRRLGMPSDLDSTLLYLVDPASAMVTGTTIIVDDAQAAR